MLPYQIVDGTAVIVTRTPAGIVPVTVSKDHPSYKEIITALISDDETTALRLLDARANAVKAARESLKLNVDTDLIEVNVDGDVTFNGIPLEPFIAQAIRDRAAKNVGIEDIARFHRRLQRNQVPKIREQLFKFLNHPGFSLLPDGRFVAYKGVYKTDDPNIFASAHDHSFFYELGVKIYENVRACDYNVDVACGSGLHVGTVDYARSYGDTFLEVLVDPAEVICVPNDSGGQKLRAKALFCHKVLDKQHPGSSSTVYEGEIESPDYEDPEPDYHADDELSQLCADEGPGEGSAGSSSKRTYYNVVTGASIRAEKNPGPGWSSTKPKPKSAAEAIARTQKAASTQSGARTYYNKQTGETTRSLTHPGPNWTTHKPKEG